MSKAENQKAQIIEWIKTWFEQNGADCKAIIGLSGGKDSTVVAKLCVEALGADRVIGVRMPANNGLEDDDVAEKIAEWLGIKTYLVPIGWLTNVAVETYEDGLDMNITKQAFINLPARLRMTTLYAIAQMINGRVANTCNLSETMLGWETRWGDSVGDFSPLANYTCTEVIEIGRALRIPTEFIEKVPTDNLCGKTDEESFGFSYAILDKYITTGQCDDPEVKEKIDTMVKNSMFKRMPIPRAPYIRI